MMRRVAAALIVLALAVASVLARQNPTAPTGQAAPRPSAPLKLGSATIVGKVIEAGTKTGVSGAVVTLASLSLGLATDVFANGVPGGARRLAVDAQGQFLFRDLPPGVYNVVASAVGFSDGSYGQNQLVRGRPLAINRFLELTDADKLVTVEISVWRKGGISGRVVDEAGEPMAGAPVTVFERLPDWTGLLTYSLPRVTTDDRGMYHVDVDPGEYLVGLIAATTTVPTSAVAGFLQAQQEGGATMQAYMSQITTSGSLLPRGVGMRVGNFMVSQFGMQNSWVVPPFATRDGRLTFYPTTFHPSSLSGAAATLITVSSGEEKAGIDITLRPVPARRVSGRVLGPNGPIAGIALRLIQPDSSATGSGIFNVAGDTPQALTDGNGDFTFMGIAPGQYTVRVLRSNTPADPVLWAVDPITVGADADLTDLTVRLQPGATIGGRLVFDGMTPPPTAAAMTAIGIRPTPMPGSPGSLMGPVGWMVRPEPTGRFASGQMVPGPYVIAVTSLPTGWMLKSVVVGGQNVTGRVFELTPSAIGDVVVTLADKVSSIAGTVRDGNGMPESQATVVVFPVDKSLWPISSQVSNRIRIEAPGRDGRYAFRGLPSGEYFVTAIDALTRRGEGSAVLNSLVSGAVRVTMGEGENKVQDLRVVVIR